MPRLTPSGSLIYEYIGEVVKENTFRKRMQQYADEGIKHFYFMMLQKEEVCQIFACRQHLLIHSTLTRPRKAGLGDSPTTPVTRIARCRSGS